MQKVDGCWPETPEYTGYTFANWDAYKGGGAPFVETTIVRGDTQVFSQKITVNGENAGTEIHVMNPNHELMRRFIELYNIANDTEYTISNVTGPVKITVYDNEGNHTNPNYNVGKPNGWNNESYEWYLVQNFNAQVGQEGDSTYNHHIDHSEIAYIEVSAEVSGVEKTVQINRGTEPGDFAIAAVSDVIVELHILQQGEVCGGDPDTPDPEPEPPAKPGDDVVASLVDNVSVDCITNESHAPATYTLANDTYTVSDVTQSADDSYTCTVTIVPDYYVSQYNGGGDTHTLATAGNATVTLKWNGSAWQVSSGTPVVFYVTCDGGTGTEYDITGITKTLVESESAASDAGITETNDYTFPTDGKVTIPKDESVTLLYSITVTGKENATFTVTDKGATLVSSNGNTVTQGTGDDADTFSGTIPEAEWITFYVSKTFDASDIDSESGKLTNKATVAGTGENDVDPENDEDVEETPAEEDDGGGEEPVPTTYTLTYDANGGDTTSVPQPVPNIPAEYELALDTTTIPTHAQAMPAGGTDAVDVLFIGWMEEDNDTIIYSRNDTAPDTITKVTFASADITVYAAWGYDEDGNGIADVLEKDSIVITPADITIYTGGAGYSGVVDGFAETVNNSGFPEPGYYITLPDELDEQLKAATDHTGDDPVDLSEYLTFSYDDNAGTTREWKLERYDNSGDSQAYGKYIYRLVPTGDAPDVRLSITDETGATMTSDNFVESIDNLYEVYSMGIYAGDLNQNLITATVTIPNEADNTNENILVGTGTLTVRGTTAEAAQAGLDGGTANGITVQAADGTTYSINESELQVAEENDVQLLVDELVDDETSIDALKTEAHEDISAIDAANHTFDFKYMDLVDSSNGNAWITTDQDLTITWAYPTGESKTSDTNFAVVHYPGLDRDYDDAAAAIGNVTAVALEIERTEDGLRFTAGADGFSPFALVSGSGTGENPLTTYQITYNANGGSGDDRIFEYAVNTATVKESLFTREGYTFTGWSTEPGGNGTNYAAGDTITLTGDITLYAQWKSNGGSSSGGTTRYTLTYESNGGTEYDSERYTRNTVVDLDKVPSREGYTFTGWYADAELTEQISEIKMTSNKTVYAGWEVTGVPDWLNGDDHFAYVIGYSDGTVKPLNNISRAEVATIFFRLLKPEIRDEYLTQTSQFTDVSADAWYNTAVSTMAALGIVNGRTADTFAPDASITRAEFAAICARFDTNKRDGDSNFSDIAGHWAEAEIERAATLGWINGYSDGTFHPDNAITRAEAMTMINRVLQRLPETEDDLLDDMNVWPDNQPSAWYYLAVQEATNSHDFDRKDDGVHETWTSRNTDPDWMQYQ